MDTTDLEGKDKEKDKKSKKEQWKRRLASCGRTIASCLGVVVMNWRG